MPTIPLADLEQKVWDQLDGNTGEFPEPNVRAVINQGLYRLNNLVGFTQATVPIPGFSIAGQILYDRPAGILIPLRVDFEGAEIEKSSIQRVARRFKNFTVDQGTPARWCLIGLKVLLIHPADQAGGGLIEVTGVAPITPLTDSAQTVNLEDEFTEILVDWAKSRLLVKEGGKAFADASAIGYQAMTSKVRQYMLWNSMKFPEYFILKESNPGSGKGT